MTDFYKTEKEIIDWLDRYNITQYTLKAHKKYGFVVNIDGDLVISNKQFVEVPVKFEHVTGFFNCSSNELTSLEFAPSFVGGNYSCSKNNLTSLKFLPQSINGNFYCYQNKLTSLKHSPHTVKGDFYCNANQIKSLKFSPEFVIGDFICSGNELVTIEFAPKFIGGDFACNDNPIESLLHFNTVYNKKFKHSHLEDMKIQGFEHLYINKILEIDMVTLRNILEKIKIFNKLNEEISDIDHKLNSVKI